MRNPAGPLEISRLLLDAGQSPFQDKGRELGDVLTLRHLRDFRWRREGSIHSLV